MKTILTFFILLTLSSVSFAQSYYNYIAKANGNFGDASTWTMVVRSDNVKQNKYTIPAAFTVIADKNNYEVSRYASCSKMGVGARALRSK